MKGSYNIPAVLLLTSVLLTGCGKAPAPVAAAGHAMTLADSYKTKEVREYTDEGTVEKL